MFAADYLLYAALRYLAWHLHRGHGSFRNRTV